MDGGGKYYEPRVVAYSTRSWAKLIKGQGDTGDSLMGKRPGQPVSRSQNSSGSLTTAGGGSRPVSLALWRVQPQVSSQQTAEPLTDPGSCKGCVVGSHTSEARPVLIFRATALQENVGMGEHAVFPIQHHRDTLCFYPSKHKHV
ncbi:unnamed protein product [Pleuronectes platessa]|uniref:Uncharacterized protein n=1 Tax=Pleuronectes platessa TaxID=8262 RepID=A0A9N7VV85_PLEPL|nr:unnamed protein product [Pleuronectes platessa]